MLGETIMGEGGGPLRKQILRLAVGSRKEAGMLGN